MHGDVVFHRRADDAVVRAFVILMRAENQDGFRQRVGAELQGVSGEQLARGVRDLNTGAVNAALPRRQSQFRCLAEWRPAWRKVGGGVEHFA